MLKYFAWRAVLILICTAATASGTAVAAPIVRAVNDGGAYTDVSNTLNASWVATGSNITEYRYAVGTSPGATNVKGWTSVGLNTSVTIDGVSLTNATTYYVAVRAYDSGGSYGSGNSDGILCDLQNPTIGAINDGGDFTRSTDTISFSFSGSDGESGIHEYGFLIGTERDPDGIVPRTSLGLTTSRTVTGLDLDDNERYIVGIYAIDKVGHVVNATSDGITVDISPPTIVYLEDGGSVTALDDRLTASWYATDDGAGVGGYRYAIGTAPDLADVVGWTNPGITNTVTRTGLALRPDVAYYFTLRAIDLIGQTMSAHTDGIRVDTSPPVIGDVTVDSVTGTSATVRWITDKAAEGVVDYGVSDGYGSQAPDYGYAESHAVMLNLLDPGQTYHFRITADDDAGTRTMTADLTFTTTTETDRIVRLSPNGVSYQDPSILQSEAKIAFRTNNNEVWVGDLSRATGRFVSGDGRNYRMDTGAKNGADVSGPQFGLDSGGWAVFYDKVHESVVQTWRARWDGNAAQPAVLTTGAAHEGAMPGRNASQSQTRLLNVVGDWDAGDVAWYLENSPNTQHLLEPAEEDETRRNPGQWLDDGKTLVSVDTATGQLFTVNTGTSQRKTITNDSGRKTAPRGWSAPEYDGETIVATVLDDTQIALYRNTGGTYWKRVATLKIPAESDQTIIATPQPFVAGDKSYLLLTIQDVPVGDRAPLDAEVWVFDLENAQDARYARRCDDGRAPMPRSNPEAFVGEDSVYVYYNTPSPVGTQDLWVCRSNIAPKDQHPLVDTDVGRIQGVRSAGADGFLNVPYAAPPTGDLRWRAPQPIASWSDVRVASRMPPWCAQPDPQQPEQAVKGAEDCLFLNIWTPSDRAPGDRLPVMFFVHGGGNRTGSVSSPISALLDVDDSTPVHDATTLSYRGNVVVVTVQYRLAALGYLAHAALAADSPSGTAGNYGILDIMEALRWVQRNIDAFGGDPDRLLLFGHSGGATDVGVLLASPLANGLFSRALMESGGLSISTAGEAEESADVFVEEMNLDGVPNLAAQLRALSLSKIVLADSAVPVGSDTSSPFSPYVDGYVVNDQPLSVVSDGAHNQVPFVIGTNAAEDAHMYHDLTVADFYEMTEALVPPNMLPELYEVYPLDNFNSPTDAYVAVVSDMLYTCNTRTIARFITDGQAPPVYRYVFRRVLSTNARLANGAYHGTEKLYLFQHMNGVHFSANDSDRTVQALMLNYWTRFAANGDPNNPASPAWPRYDTESEPYMILDVNAASGTQLRKARCDFWDSVRIN